MARNNRPVEEIDEAAMLQSIYERDNGIAGVPPKPQAQPVASPETEQQPEMPEKPKEEKRSGRTGQQQYESLFIRESDLPPARFGKSVYIRREYHDRISQIISVIGSNEVSLFGYIDNVLTHHFENFGDDIVRSFKKNVIFK
ncbi:MAG: DUF3408 domain-containing protein [Tannerella sp.]|jgi:hypothetical protein|nr:DUF3408 domain-containing protein [Tannerella sp.]